MKGALSGRVGAHRAPIGALCEGSSMRIYNAPLNFFEDGGNFFEVVGIITVEKQKQTKQNNKKKKRSISI